MNKRIIAPILILSFIVILASCKKTQQGGNKVTFDSIVVKEHVQLLEVNDTTLPYADLNISFIYPKKFKSEVELARLQQIFVGTFFSDVLNDSMSPQEATDNFINNYKEDYQSLSNSYYEEVKRLPEGSSGPMWYWYYMNLNNKIMFECSSILSYGVENSTYTGGAHGSFTVTYTNINLNELTTISEEDLFVPNYQKKLAEIIVNRLMQDHNVSTYEGLLEQGFFNIEDIFPNNNFWLDDKGIHYAFNQYEIAPYVMGVIEVNIPYEDLKSILKPDSGIEKFFPKAE